MKHFSNFKSALDMYNGENDRNYRQRGFENTRSNHGWYECVKCGRSFRKGDMDIDHIIPQSKGGDCSRENLQCICKYCNRSKQADMSETAMDLRRRKRELAEQNREDREFVRRAMKYKNKI